MKHHIPIRKPKTAEGLGSRGGRVMVTCTFCNKEFERYFSQTRMPDGRPRKVFKCKDCRKVPWEVRFERMIDTSSNPKGCKIWKGGLNADGYPNFPCPELGEWRGNRIAWLKAGNVIPEDKPYVLHKQGCHNRKCVNVDHLYCGTQEDNMRDAIEQGTKVVFRGTDNPNSVLDDAAVLDILRSPLSANDLSKIYPVTPGTIRDIRTRSWNHLKQKPTPPNPQQVESM